MNDSARRLDRKARWIRAISWLTFMPWAGTLMFLFRYGLRYRVEDVARWRKFYRELCAEGRPLLICANHLSYIDPVLLIYAFASHGRYFLNFRTLPWNLPAVEYARKPLLAAVAMSSKCLFIDRSGTAEEREAVYDVASRLMARGEVFMIFPEGRRSRIGKFDPRKLAYGIGKVVTRLPEVDVLCVYVRAPGQNGMSGFPRFGSRFRLSVDKITFRKFNTGREGVAEVTETIAARIQALESRHFDCLSDAAG